MNGQNNYVVVPCQDLAEVTAACSLDPIEILLEEISPSGIYQINTGNAEAIKVEKVKNTNTKEKTARDEKKIDSDDVLNAEEIERGEGDFEGGDPNDDVEMI